MHHFRGKLALCGVTSGVYVPAPRDGRVQQWLLEQARALELQRWLLMSPFPPSLPFPRLMKPHATVHECRPSWACCCWPEECGVSRAQGPWGCVQGATWMKLPPCARSLPALITLIVLWEPGQTWQWWTKWELINPNGPTGWLFLSSYRNSGTDVLLEVSNHPGYPRVPHPPWLQIWGASPRINNCFYLKSRTNAWTVVQQVVLSQGPAHP